MRHTFRYLLPGDPLPGATVVLPAPDSHHLVRVVRRRVGDPVEMIDATGRIWPATVVEDGEPAAVRLAAEPVAGPPAAPVVLYQGLAEWNRLDTVVEKCAELGLPRVVLVTGDRVRRTPEPDAWRRRRERLVRVAEAAARQSGQAHLPAVEGILSLDEALDATGGMDRVMLDPRGEAPLTDVLDERPDPGAPLAVLVGPDAGWSAAEVARARSAGVPVCRMGPSVLRAETAGIVAVAVALAAAGYLARSGRDAAASAATTPEAP